jgi:hypothetical protein
MLELFGSPRPSPELAGTGFSITDHLLDSLSLLPCSGSIRDVFGLVCTKRLFGDAGTGSSEGVELATTEPPDTRRALGVRYPSEG